MSGKKVEIVSELDEFYLLLLLHKVTYHGREISYLKKSEIADLLIDHGAKLCFSFEYEGGGGGTATLKTLLGFRLTKTGHPLIVGVNAGVAGDQIYNFAIRVEKELKRPRATMPSPPATKGDKKEKFLQQLEGLGVFTETERDLVEFFVEHGTRAVKPIYLDYPPDDATDCCVPWCGDREKGVRIRPLKFTFPKFDRQLEAIERCIRDFFLSDG